MIGINADNLRIKAVNDEQVIIQTVRGKLFQLIHRFFCVEGYMLVDPPVLHEKIPNKKSEIYLPPPYDSYSLNFSNALYMGAYAALFGKVYAISPCFRDEQDSTNHLLEFRMLEVEILGVDYDDLPFLIERLICYILTELMSSPIVTENTRLKLRLKDLSETFHPRRVTYSDFIEEINQKSELKLDSEIDLSSVDTLVSEYISDPVLIMDFPISLASWTAKRKGFKEACAVNLFLPDSYGELCEGCERTNSLELLENKFKCAKISNLQWYIDAISKIDKPRCGFGIGLDRLVRWIVGAPDIVDTVLFPRVKK